MNGSGKARILLVEDDAGSRETTRAFLERSGYEVLIAEDGGRALQRLSEGVAVILTDLKMPRVDGMELLRVARQEASHTPVIMITGQGSEEAAVEALKAGAFHYLTKPVNPQHLRHVVQQALDKYRMALEIAELHQRLSENEGVEDIIGTSMPMRKVLETIRIAADTVSTVLITGETGTGKELVAKALHTGSSRRAKPFVVVNCPAIPDTLIESELFGHVKGAFTGAVDNRTGRFVAADGGTLLIDEIGDMQLGLQAKLLRAIETCRISPIGSNKETEVDVRILASTHRDLSSLVAEGKFREDLYYRLNVVQIVLPSLRERREDIPLIVRAFIDELASKHKRPVRDISPEALARLQNHSWPGNVRQLRNMLESIIVLSTREIIDVADLPDILKNVSDAPTLQSLISAGSSLPDIEREVVRQTLERTGGNRAETAQILGISGRTLQRRIKEYNLPF